MLFAHLERHAQRALAAAVYRYADDSSRHVALECLAGRHVACRRTSEAHRAAEPLRRSDRDVGVPLGRRREQCEREQVGFRRNERSRCVCGGREVGIVADFAVRRRILDDCAELLARKLVTCEVVHNQFDAERFAAGKQHVERLREYVFIDEKLVASRLDGFARTEGEHHEHRFRRCRALVEQRAVGDFHSRQRANRRLEIEQRFQSSLRNLRLIRGVGGVPRRILEYVAHDRRRNGVRIVAHSDERAELAVLVGYGADVRREFVFAHSVADGERLFEPDALRNDL